MKTVYPTKVSVTLVLIISIIVGCTLIPLIINSKWILFFIDLLVYAIVLYLMLSIKYEINDSQLIIHQAIGKMIIDINTIKSIEPTHTILSAPASSLDRLRISYNKYDEVVISPRRKEEFIRQLQYDFAVVQAFHRGQSLITDSLTKSVHIKNFKAEYLESFNPSILQSLSYACTG